MVKIMKDVEGQIVFSYETLADLETILANTWRTHPGSPMTSMLIVPKTGDRLIGFGRPSYEWGGEVKGETPPPTPVSLVVISVNDDPFKPQWSPDPDPELV